MEGAECFNYVGVVPLTDNAAVAEPRRCGHAAPHTSVGLGKEGKRERVGRDEVLGADADGI